MSFGPLFPFVVTIARPATLTHEGEPATEPVDERWLGLGDVSWLGMQETPFSGFRIAATRPDENAEGGFSSMTFLVVAEYQEDAEGAVRAYLQAPCTLELGPAVLDETRRLG